MPALGSKGYKAETAENEPQRAVLSSSVCIKMNSINKERKKISKPVSIQ
jgi:hypothetical protein